MTAQRNTVEKTTKPCIISLSQIFESLRHNRNENVWPSEKHRKIFSYRILVLQNKVDAFSTYFIQRHCWQRHSEKLKIRCGRGWRDKKQGVKVFSLRWCMGYGFLTAPVCFTSEERLFKLLWWQLILQLYQNLKGFSPSVVQILQMSFTLLYVPTQQDLFSLSSTNSRLKTV